MWNKNCPFCGGRPQIEYQGYHYRVRCKACGARTKDLQTKQAAIEAWNRRTKGNDGGSKGHVVN